MAADPGTVLELLRNELRASGYGPLVLEAELASEGNDSGGAQALDELLDRLQKGVVPAILAHAASIRNLNAGPSPTRQLREPSPRRSDSGSDGIDHDADDIVISLNEAEASQVERYAHELDQLLSEVRGVDANDA
jgi:hypothetical protein